MAEEAFEVFFSYAHPLLVRYARRFVDAETANDVAVDTMGAVWDKWKEKPRDEAGVKQALGLCYRIADGLIRNAVRSERRRRLLEGRAAHDLAADIDSVPDMAERVAGNSRIAGLLGQLSRRDRQVLLLMDDGHTMAEIGEMLGCSAAAVKMRLRRAKNRLKRLIEDEERGEEAGRDADTRQPSR